MPLSSTLSYIRGIIDGQFVPGEAGPIEAFVNPPDPEITQGPPHVYVWTSRGNERRNSGPRSKPPAGASQYNPAGPAGWKLLNHDVEIWITWFLDNTDPQQDNSFPLVMDFVMNILRTAEMPMTMIDPATGYSTQLIDLGKNMSYEYAPLRSTASQRYHRYDGTITAPVEEWLQA
jgi:hypothetical protein